MEAENIFEVKKVKLRKSRLMFSCVEARKKRHVYGEILGQSDGDQ